MAEEDDDIDMATCGACQAIIPLESNSCPACSVSFTGVMEDDLGECGACGALVSLESNECPQCGVLFVHDDVIAVMIQWMSDTGFTVEQLFGRFDTDGDGQIDVDEMRGGLVAMRIAVLPPVEVDRLVSIIDADGNGTIDMLELRSILATDQNETEDGETPTSSQSDSTTDSPEDSMVKGDEVHTVEPNVEKETKATSSMDLSKIAELVDEDEADPKQLESEDELSDEHISAITGSSSSEDKQDSADDTEPEEPTSESLREGTEQEPKELGESGEFESDAVSEDTDIEHADTIGEESVETDSPEDDSDSQDNEDVESDDTASDDSEEEDASGEETSDETLEDDSQADSDETTTSEQSSSEPAPWQVFLMKNYENVFPVLYVLGVLGILLFSVNAMFGPINGSAGTIAFDGDVTTRYDFTWDDQGIKDMVTSSGYELSDMVDPGQAYPCDPDIQKSECRNTLTPLAGASSSMPKGWYWDGIIGLLFSLGIIGGTTITQKQIKELRDTFRMGKKTESDSDSETEEISDVDDSDSQSNDGVESDSSDELDSDAEVMDGEESTEGYVAEDDDDSGEEESDDVEDSDGDSVETDEEADSDGDGGKSEGGDEVDIGDRVGVVIDGEEQWGEIVDFEGDEEIVVLLEDNDEEVIVDWNDLFLEED